MNSTSGEDFMEKPAVIVTGASRGIGLAIARRLAGANYRLALVARQAEALAKVVEELGPVAHAFPADISDFEAVQQVVSQVNEAFGGIFGLVNNAGMTKDGLFVRMSPEQWQAPLDVNLNGTFNFCRAASVVMMRARAGRIINISSVIGLTGNAGQANYAASKAGIIALTKSIAKELGGRNVLCNAVAPGFIRTDMTAELSDKVREAMLANIPLKRFGEGEDVAGVVEFLLSPAADYITGQTLVVDGGMVL